MIGSGSVPPQVSVVIVNWNTRDLLQRALGSLYSESEGVSFETIVVDNGSNDGSGELIRKEWPTVNLVSLPVNRGFAVANNIGFARSRGEYVLLLNSDTVVLKTTLSGLSTFLDERKGAGCVGAKHLNPDSSLQRSMDHFPSLLNDFVSYTELYRLSFVQHLLRERFPWWSDHNTAREVDWVNGACMMVRRTVIEEVGGLDENFFIYGEELDWCYRMRKAGWQVYFTPASEVIHLGGQAMNSAADRRVVLKYSGQLRFYRKHYGPLSVQALRALLVLTAAARLAGIGMFWGLARAGINVSPILWELVTQEPVRTSHLTMARAWYRILTLR